MAEALFRQTSYYAGLTPLGVAAEFGHDSPPPSIEEVYQGEVAAMYSKEGWQPTAWVRVIDPEMTVRQALTTMTFETRQKIKNGHAILGCMIGSEGLPERGVGVWVKE
jgi:hypothetical protein